MLALMINVSAASPFGDTAKRVEFMCQWAEKVVASSVPPDLVFAQEVNDEWLGVWPDSQYKVVAGGIAGERQFKVRSALIARRASLDVAPLGPFDVPTLAYHGSYVAAARCEVSGTTVLLLSVHAAPSTVEKYAKTWPVDVPPPVDRATGVASPSWQGLWDADAMLATLRHHGGQEHVLAAGDLNEARNWDLTHPGRAGRDYFARLAAAGLHDVLFDRWQEERPTRRAPGHPDLQLDHVVATHALAECVTDANVEATWSARERDPNWSDHAPVWFTIDLDRLAAVAGC